MNWTQPGEKKLTGGSNWQPKVAPTTAWNAPTVVSSCLPSEVVTIKNSNEVLNILTYALSAKKKTIEKVEKGSNFSDIVIDKYFAFSSERSRKVHFPEAAVLEGLNP